MRAQIVERYTLLVGKLTYTIAQAVVQALHECTLLNIKNLVKCSGNMKTKSIHVIILDTRLHLFPCKPALVAERKLQFIAVLTRILGAQDRHYRRKLDLANTCKGIDNLLLLVFELVLIGQTLPFTTTTDAIMLTERLTTFLRIFIELDSLGLGITMLLALHLEVNHITRHHVRHEHNKVIYPCKCLALGRHSCNLHFFKQREFFLFSCHISIFL